MKVKASTLWAVLLFLFALEASAQTKPITVQKQIKLPTNADLSKIMSRDRIRLIQLSQTDKLKIANDALKEKGVTTTVSSFSLPVKMSVMSPKAGGDNYLSYFRPWNVMVTGDNVQFSGVDWWQDSSLAVSFKPTAPGYYLLDVSVRKQGGATFSMLTIDGKNTQSQKYPAGPLNNDHVIFVVNFAEAKQQIIFLYGDREWEFYECEISQIK